MKANELKVTGLMVGDLVLHDGKVIRVDAVHKRKIGYHKTKDKLTWLFDGQFQHIQITEELLEKNLDEIKDKVSGKAFVLSRDFYEEPELIIRQFDWNESFAICTNEHNSALFCIMYLHELQHFLKLIHEEIKWKL